LDITASVPLQQRTVWFVYTVLGKLEGNPPKKTSAPKAPAFYLIVASPYLSRVAYLYPKESKTILIKKSCVPFAGNVMSDEDSFH
jgi:hypothetical protein